MELLFYVFPYYSSLCRECLVHLISQIFYRFVFPFFQLIVECGLNEQFIGDPSNFWLKDNNILLFQVLDSSLH